jgi:serine/threonine protein kinase/formylglycine-generating enzyme required for sulfatase activity
MALKPSTQADRDDRLDEVVLAYLKTIEAGQTPDRQEILACNSDLADDLTRFFHNQDRLNPFGSTLLYPLSDTDLVSAHPEQSPLPRICCPHCHNPFVVVDDRSKEVLCPGCGSSIRVCDALMGTTAEGRCLGKFQLLERVGLGSFGAVWRAHDTELDRIVALKIPHTGLLSSATDLERFHREARAAAQLRHPGIVTVYEVQTLEGLPTLVEDFIQGVPLKELLQTRPLTFRETASLMADVSEALHYAHTMGLVHRDIKPANIIIEYGGEPEGVSARRTNATDCLGKPLIMDFGLALRDQAEITMTMDGQIIGTPAYMSPEQAAGKSHQADARSDVFSLGVILYEMLTGELPFRGSRLMIVHQVLREEPRPPRSLNNHIPRDLETVVLRCLEKEPTSRYKTAQALAQELRRFLAGRPIEARPVSRAERAWRWCRRNPAVASLTLAFTVFLALLACAGYESHGRLQARAFRDRLLNANTADVPAIVADMGPYRRWLDPLLREANHDAAASQDARKQLHTSLALLPVDGSQTEYLYERLLRADAQEVNVIRDFLAPHKDELVERLWVAVEQPARGQESQRLRGACALATFDPDSSRWENIQRQVAGDLVTEPAVYLATWMEYLRPVGGNLLTSLSMIYRDAERRETERSLATEILADYAADQPQKLADLLMDADDRQFAVIFPKLKNLGEGGLPWLQEEIDKQILPDAKDDDKEKLAKRRTNAAVALLQMGWPDKVWPLLKHSPDQRVRSYLIDRIGSRGVDTRVIVKRLQDETDVTIFRALILSLGEFSEKDWVPDDRNVVTKKVREHYQLADDPGLRAAAEWLLRHWKEDQWLQRINHEWATNKEQRDKRLEGILRKLTQEKEQAEPQWYVSGQGQTMVVIPGPVKFMMGSPPGEEGRYKGEILHRKLIGRTFAIAAHPVTKEQFLRFLPEFTHSEMRRYPEPTCPIGGVTWYKAAAYCNWLSKLEAIEPEQWCYEMDRTGQVVKLKEAYLSLTGFRLPTEAEMEYATRAAAVTSRFYGDTDELLEKYSWYSQKNRDHSWPVGEKKPNDLGLFDMQGNVWCWCQERYKPYSQSQESGEIEDIEDTLVIDDKEFRVLRGGSFSCLPVFVRSANRGFNLPTLGLKDFGFRVARTLQVNKNTP